MRCLTSSGLDGTFVVLLLVLDDLLAGEEVDTRAFVVSTVGVDGIGGVITVALPVPEDQTVFQPRDLVPSVTRRLAVCGHHDAWADGVDDDELAPVAFLDLGDHGDRLGHGGGHAVSDELPPKSTTQCAQLEFFRVKVAVVHLRELILTIVLEGALEAVAGVHIEIHHGRPADEELELDLHRVGSAVRRTLTQDLEHHLLLEPELIDELHREVPQREVAGLLDIASTEVAIADDLVLSVVHDHCHDLPTRELKPTRLHTRLLPEIPVQVRQCWSESPTCERQKIP